MTAVSVLLCLALLALLLYRFYLNNIKRPPKYPPGPPRIPYFEDYGLLLLINFRHLHRAAEKLANFYRTNILGLSLVGVPVLVVSDLSIAREVLTRPEFDGRPNLFLALMREKFFRRRGVFFTDGPEWNDQRRFFLRQLRDYGFGRRSERYEQEVESELLELVDVIKSGPRYDYEKEFMQDGFVKCPNIFFVVLGNAFLHILTGERYDRSQAEPLVNAAKYGLLFLRNGDDYGTVFSFIPWLRFIYPFTLKYRTIRKGVLGLIRFIETNVMRQKNTFDPSYPRNFVDIYLREMQRHIPQEDTFTFQLDQLVAGLADFYLPAISGTSIQLSMLLERLLLQPNVAKRIQQEIDEVVGAGRLPTLDDRISLPYTEATLRESLRIDTLIPSGIVHRTLHNTTLQGYDIPANTLILTSLDRVNNQTEVWGDPETFRPERFLGDDGRLALSKDRSLSFGAGRRLCAGETYTRNTMFLVLATIMQNFNLEQRPSDPLPDVTKRRTAFISSPEDFWIQFVPR